MIEGKGVILLVEDSRAIRLATSRALEQAGYIMRMASGNCDLEQKIAADPAFLQGVDLIVLDMELEEPLERQREDKSGVHIGSQMTGSQIGVSLGLVHAQLQSVPFLVYSAKEPEEIEHHLHELAEFAEMDGQIKNNCKGFILKTAGAESLLVEKSRQILFDHARSSEPSRAT